MAFLAKTDYFGLTSIAGLSCVSNSDGRAFQVVEAKDAAGSIAASEVFGESYSPSNSYVVKSDLSSSTTGGVVGLGKCTDTEIGSVCLASFSINTSTGSPTSIEASGESVEADATADCKYMVPGFDLPKTHHAHILFEAFELSGSGCYLQTANYSCTASITKATKDGVCLAHDVSEGKIECQATITQTGSTSPTVTAGSGWKITSPLACDNPDADYPTYSITLTKYLTRT